METELLNERELATWLGVSCAKLQADRYYRRGIPYTRLGRAVRYRRCDVEAFIASNNVETRTA